MAGGRKSKYHSHVEPKLLMIEAWARDGLTQEDIAAKLGVALSSFCDYKNKFPELSDALKKGQEVADVEVENALFKRAVGYDFVEKKYAPAEMSEEEYELQQELAANKYKLDHPEASLMEIRAVKLGVPRYKMVLVEEKTKEVSPDVTAQIFWLKNRRPETWRDKKEIGGEIGLKKLEDFL